MFEQPGNPLAPPPPPGGGAPPANLPIAGPTPPTPNAEDIFAGIREPAPAPAEPVAAVPPIGEQAARSGAWKKIVLVVGAVVLLGIIGVVVWLTLFQGEEQVVAPEGGIPSINAPEGGTPEPGTAANGGAAGVNTPDALPGGAETDEVGAPAPAADADGDGLSDEEEASLGTNPQSADTDGDGLSDRDEVRIYRTDPLDPDTDDDGYLDGEEVRNGYDPNVKGKRLFEVPPAS